ncbi:hypothetical protein [Nonomuraea sp. NPDC003804]|uniref:hypothetical protein n=1 Tax=Nonomuraea sp. NPDC003804 TaxID=3154547 RepID=UPI0033B41011
MIDRERLVRGHNVVVTTWHPSSTLSVGNGDFAVNVDVTGLQTFPREHELLPRPVVVTDEHGVRRLPPREFDLDDFPVPLRVQSTWGWYATAPGRPYTLDEAATGYRTRRGEVRYPDGLGPAPEAAAWLYANPRRLDLGRLGLDFAGRQVGLGDLTATRVELDLWTGCVHARFTVFGRPVEVWTVVHPDRDLVATRVRSPLLADGRLRLRLSFPDQADPLLEGEKLLQETVYGEAWAERRVGDARYVVEVATDGVLGPELLIGTTADELTATAAFAATRAGTRAGDLPASEPTTGTRAGDLPASEPATGTRAGDLPAFEEVRQVAAAHWRDFWTRGAAISFEGSSDPRARELERRVVLSRYLTAVHCAGTMPPQESGLVHNSWGGKFHLEMHWWHAAHFAVWGRPDLLERSLGWYRDILGAAGETARRQGYAGARWPKQVGPDGRESPSDIGAFIIWQQPHPIYYAELLRLNGGGDAVLERYREIVLETAAFMADFAEEDGGTYHLGPPVVPAQETYYPDRARTADPTFELAYWAWALGVAQDWRERLGMGRCAAWDAVIDGLARPPVRDGVYAAVAVEPYTVTDDHPSMLMALGFVPETPMIDRDTMAATYDDVLARWDFSSTWGWDYPVLAMCATKLGRPEAAVDALLMDTPKNRTLAGGHVPQFRGGLSVYLPANGGLLAAVAMMAKEGGFPRDGTWRVRQEGFGAFPTGTVSCAPAQ